MGNIQFQELNIKNIEAVTAFERALYRAFYGTDFEEKAQFRDYDHKTRRARSKIPYEDQLIFVGTFEGAVICGVSINRNMRSELQLERLGFTIDKSEPAIAEGLGLFNLQMFAGTAPIALEYGRYVTGQLNMHGIRKLYGTCSQKNKRGYEMMGFDILDKRIFIGETAYLMELHLAHTSD